MQPLPSIAAVLEKLRARGVQVPPGLVRVDRYGDSEEQSAALLTRIRDGRKRAGTSLLWALEADAEAVPEAGQIEVVVDHQNEPVLISPAQSSPWCNHSRATRGDSNSNTAPRP